MPEDIILDTTIPIRQAARSYDRVKVFLSVAPRHANGTIDYTASIRVLPYRVLADGSIDDAPDHLARIFNIGSTVAGEPHADTLVAILAVLRTALKALR